MFSGATRNTEKLVADTILELGIKPNLLGFSFLKDCSVKGIEDPKSLNKLTSLLYPSIATEYNTTPCKVERCIRSAIESAYLKNKLKHLDDMFGIKFFDTYEKPSNGTFIAFLADRLRFMK